jgi:hypothetical protein
MSRLIDADTLKKVLEWCPYDEWFSEIDRLPTVDAVEVVRCGECRYYPWCVRLGKYMDETDYCSKGER